MVNKNIETKRKGEMKEQIFKLMEENNTLKTKVKENE